jgi:small-conductance mechanosensitive channel
MLSNNVTISDILNLTSTTISDKINLHNANIYVTALVIFAVSISILRIFKFVVIKKLKMIAAKTLTKYDDIAVDMVDKIGWHFYILIALYITFNYLASSQFGLFSEIKTILYYTIVIIIIYHAVKTIQALVDHSTELLIMRKDIDVSTIELLNRIIKSGLWIVALILILSRLGYDVTALVAGLGIGGIAIAFALQNILGDIFASCSIFLDKPFKRGDYIIFGAEEGIVKKIGMKSTRVEALQGQEIIVPNKTLTDTTVHNYKKMDYRRIVFNFSIKYETTTANLEKIPNIVKEIITNIKMIRFGRAHFYKFGDFGYIFEVVYFIDSGDYSKYMDKQQEINFAIKRSFENEGIEIAYPAYWQKPIETAKPGIT